MWTRSRPFPGLNDFAILIGVAKGDRQKRPVPEDCQGEVLPEDVWALIEKCWAQDAGVRPRMAEVVKSIEELRRP
jgi:hypothetical protein